MTSLLCATNAVAQSRSASSTPADAAGRWLVTGTADRVAQALQPGVTIAARRRADVDGDRIPDLVLALHIPDELSAVAVMLRVRRTWQPVFVVGMDSCDELTVATPALLAVGRSRFVHVSVTRCGQPQHDHLLYAIADNAAVQVWSSASDTGTSFAWGGNRYRVVLRGRNPARLTAIQ